jgi:hypothetical protein
MFAVAAGYSGGRWSGVAVASTHPSADRRSRRYDFHAERVRRRILSRMILLAAFLIAGAAMILAAMYLTGR